MKGTFAALGVSCAALALAAVGGTGLGAIAGAAPAAGAPAPAENLVITSAVRASTIEAGAAHFNLPAADFLGLGSPPDYEAAYYGYDRETLTYWAGASLIPSPRSPQAGVVVQDDGAYLIFDRSAAGAWQVHDVGYTDTVGTCARYHVSIPAAVVAVWHWTPGTCHPPNVSTPPSGSAANLSVTTALDDEIRTSYYAAYRADSKPMAIFGVAAGLPESRVEGPSISHAGIIYGSVASADSTWVVASICFDIPTGCEDAGAFQVFRQEGLGAFTYLLGNLCAIPAALAKMWYAGGVYPMGERCSAPSSVSRQPVLGSASFIPRIGVGWGTYKPSEIFNGGDPSGMVDKITWTGWGRSEAIGYGKTYIFEPKGGYYPGSVTAELEAFDLGHCSAGGPLAYELLKVREPSKPGGALGAWFVWDGVKTLCKPYE